MRSYKRKMLQGTVFASLCLAGPVWAHPGHFHPQGAEHDHVRDVAPAARQMHAQAEGEIRTSGQGDLKFRVFATSGTLPEGALEVLVKAHGGFAVDRREGQGEVYFALPGAGIIQLSPDLKQSTLIETDPQVRDTNMHNTAIWYGEDGTPYLSFPANEANKVYTTTLEGKLVHTLEAPQAFDFDEPAVNKYFAEGGKFVPTDVAKLRDLFYVTTGYSNLDYVLTARVDDSAGVKAEWNDFAFGGKGEGPGQFGTGHGITITPDERRITVADRPNSQLERFTRMGQYRDTVELPKGSFPCDVDYEGEYTVVGCLHGPDRSLGAPIYIVKDDQVVSTIMPKEELGLEKFTHIHNAVMVTVHDTLYVIAQAWNPGDFAILEQVK